MKRTPNFYKSPTRTPVQLREPRSASVSPQPATMKKTQNFYQSPPRTPVHQDESKRETKEALDSIPYVKETNVTHTDPMQCLDVTMTTPTPGK